MLSKDFYIKLMSNYGTSLALILSFIGNSCFMLKHLLNKKDFSLLQDKSFNPHENK